jgi:tetratricopeptide (TPR) repeat protein
MFKFRHSFFILLLTLGCGSKEEPLKPSAQPASELEKPVAQAPKAEKPKPSPSGFVIVKDMEAVVGKMLELNRSSAADMWKLESAQIADNHIKVLYKSKEREVVLELHHPKQTEAEFELIGPFAVVGELPRDLKEVFIKRIEDQAKSFSWKHVVSKTEGEHEGEDKESPQKSDRPDEAKAKERHQAEAPFQLSEAGRAIETQLSELFKKAWAGNAPDWDADVAKIMAPSDVHPTLLYRIATSVRDLKSPAEARPIYERILKSLSAMETKLGLALPVRLELSRASAFLGVEDTKSAVQSLDKALGLGASDTNWNPCQVPHYMMSAVGMADKKILHNWLDRFIAAQPDCRLAYRIKVDDFAARGNRDKAIELLWDLDKKGKAELSDFYRVAELLVENEQNDKAVEVYRRICATLECTAHTRGNLVWAQSSFHRDPVIIKHYVGEAEANHNNSIRQFEVGVMLHYARRYKESLPFLIRASKLWPDDPRILLYTAMNYYRSGQQEKAEVGIEHAVTNASQRDPDLYYCRSVIFRNSNLAKGLENLERYRTLSSRGDVPPQKKKMVDDFIQAMKDELKRRANGEEARPFADPEEDFFGEPPGSPGHAENAIHIPH